MTYLIIYLVAYITFTSLGLYNEVCENRNYDKSDMIEIIFISALWPILVILTIMQLIRELWENYRKK